jgi:hypothetical protein
MKFKNTILACAFLVTAFSTASAFAANDRCVSSSGGWLTLKKQVALQKNGKNCTPATCNNKSTDYLKACQEYVHADCYRVFKNGKPIRTIKTGFHRGIDEGGSTNNHYWDNVTQSIRLNDSAGLWVHAYDKSNCTGKRLKEFKM